MRCLAMLLVLLFPTLVPAQATVAPAREYAPAVEALEAFIGTQVEQKKLPALSIALVDDQKVVWARGFGYADPARKRRATAETVYRVGSVSKLFTDLAVMQLVEKGEMDLDGPINRILPDFHPANPFGKPIKAITLRQLMAHRSGLMREPPIGNYFDHENDSLARMVASLKGMPLIYEPEQRTKYSNAGIAVVGYSLEVYRKQPFARVLANSLLGPLGMESSSFEPTAAIQKKLARAIMWSYHGREFPAPTFELGMAPAGSMYSSVLDLARFTRMLFAGGSLDGKQIIGTKTLNAMWKPQFVDAKVQEGFGLGFDVRRWKDRRRIGHNGAVYGFATDLSTLPEDRLAVIVTISCDCANAVATHIADVALEHLLAVKAKKPLPAIDAPSRLSAEDVARLAGRYESKNGHLDLEARGGKLYLLGSRGGYRVQLSRMGENLIADDRLGYGLLLHPIENGFRIDRTEYRKVAQRKPADIPDHWRGLLGAYGPDHNPTILLEKDGKLHVLIEWFFLYPLTEESENVYRFPADYGLYHGEKLIFTRKGDRAIEVKAAGMTFERRKLDGEDGSTFRIKPVRSLDEIRRLAYSATPPVEDGTLFRKSELVELTRLDSSLKLDIRYAGTNNFLSIPFYRSARAFLQKPAADAVVRVHRGLAKQGLGLLIHDGYRPWAVTKMFWEATPENLRIFVANPAQGSRHNRGCAVDLTLYDRKTGQPIPMVGGYDEMSDRSYPDYLGGTSLQRWHRDLLRKAMEAEGFTVYEAEWWHFDYRDWRKYPIGNAPFEDLGK